MSAYKVVVAVIIVIILVMTLAAGAFKKKSLDYFPLIFSGILSVQVLDEVSDLVHQKSGVKATWILNCDRSSQVGSAIDAKVLDLKKRYGDEIGFSLRSGMGLASGGGVANEESVQVYQELDACFEKFKDYFGSYPILHLWISDIGILKHISEKYGAQIAITSNWQQYKTDDISSVGSFDYPYFPSLNHPLVPGKKEYLDILNYETEHPDLYWAKISGTRPVFEPINANSLEQMKLLTHSVFRESKFNSDQIRLLPSIIELGYIYNPVTPNNSGLEKVQLLKDYITWMYREYSNINYVDISTFNIDFRKQQKSNSKSYALMQSGTNGAWSSYIYPARSKEYKVFMFWSQSYRGRLVIKEGKGGYIRLTDYTPYSDEYKPELSPQDISIYQGVNFLELDNIGLKEEWVYREGALQLNSPRTSDLDHEVRLESIKKDGEDYTLKFSIRAGTNKVLKTVSFLNTGIKYQYEWGVQMPLRVNLEVFKATYQLTDGGRKITSGKYSPGSITPTARDFIIENNQTLGTLDVSELKQAEDTPLEWSSSNQPDDIFIPAGFSSLTNSISVQNNGYFSINMREK